MSSRPGLLLAGDVGATKTVLALVSFDGDPRTPAVEVTYQSAAHDSLEAVVRRFLVEVGGKPDRASFGVPGPVVGGVARLTNLPWTIDAERLAGIFGWSAVTLVNDLHATAAAIPHLRADDVRTLQAGAPAAGGAIAVVAPGTGLGQSFLTWDGRRYVAHPGEGGHADFGPNDPEQVALLGDMQARFGHVSVERVCSGSGVPNIYRFLRDSGRYAEPIWLASALAAEGDPTPTIVAAAFDADRPCPLARAALGLFVRILGAESGNLALKVLATGGVYLAGGMPPRLLPALAAGDFLGAFRAKGRYGSLLARMPVHVVLNPRAAVLGACYLGLDR